MAREQSKIISHVSDLSVTGGTERAIHTCRDGEAPPVPSRGTVPSKAGVLQKGGMLTDQNLQVFVRSYISVL